MDDRIQFINYQGKQVLLVDVSHCKASEVLKVSEALPSYVTAEPRGSVLLLADFTGAEFSREVITRIKETAVFHRPHLKRSAWVGTDSMPKIFYENIRAFSQRELPTFKTREEALEWLVRD